jgi:hypothetical protein
MRKTGQFSGSWSAEAEAVWRAQQEISNAQVYLENAADRAFKVGGVEAAASYRFYKGAIQDLDNLWDELADQRRLIPGDITGATELGRHGHGRVRLVIR